MKTVIIENTFNSQRALSVFALLTKCDNIGNISYRINRDGEYEIFTNVMIDDDLDYVLKILNEMDFKNLQIVGEDNV